MSIQVGARVRWSDYYLQTYRNTWLATHGSEKSRALREYETMKAKRGTIKQVTERGVEILFDNEVLP